MTKKRQNLVSWLTLAAILLFQTGCTVTPKATQPRDDVKKANKVDKNPVKPIADAKTNSAKPLQSKSQVIKPKPQTELSGEVLYYIFSAEIAAQRGKIALAAALYTKAAQVTRDPRVAQQATRAAYYARDDKSALISAKLWNELEPQNIEARQVLAALLVRLGKTLDAVEHFEYVLNNSKKNERQRYMLIASLLSKEKDKQAALSVMKNLIAKRQDNPHALYAFSQLAFLVESLSDAADSIKKVIKLRPEWTESYVLQSNIFIRQGNKAQAIEVLQKTVETKPKNSELRMFYARSLVDAKQYNEAIKQFERLMDEEKYEHDARYALGLLALQMNKPKKATEHFSQLLEDKEHVVESQYYLAQSFEFQNKLAKAMKAYKQVGENQYYFEAELRIALILAKQGKVSDARLRLQNMSPDSEEKELRVYLTEGEILNTAKQYEAALELYNEALQQLTDNNRLLYARALTAEKLGKVDLAIKDLESIVKREPENTQALNALGYTLVDKTKRLESGLSYIKKALQLEPNDAAILDSMGWAYYRLGEYDKALKYLRRAFEQLKDAEVAAHLGEVLWVAGDREEAQDIWNTALQQQPNDDLLLNVMQKFTE